MTRSSLAASFLGSLLRATINEHATALDRAEAATVSFRQFGAVGDGVTDDTAAVQAAMDAGKPIRDTGTFLVSSAVPKASLYGGFKLLRKPGSTGNFVTTGAAGLHIDCEIDQDNVGIDGHALVIAHEFVSLPPSAIVRNSPKNGVDARNVNYCRVHAQIYDCIQSGAFVYASTQHVLGAVVEPYCDATALGTANQNGGVKVHGTASFAVVTPQIGGIVRLFESVSMPANAVCFETHTNVIAPVIKGVAIGGSIGCTMNGSPNGVAIVQAFGQHNLGLEITAGSHGARFASGSVSAAGTSVAPSFNCQGSNSTDILFDARASGATNARDAQSACFYVTGCDRATLRGNATRTGGLQLVRIINSDDVDLQGLVAAGSGTTRAILLDTTGGTCDRLRVTSCTVTGITNFIQATGTYAGGRVATSRIDNSGLLIAGSPTLTEYQFAPDCKITTHPFGARGTVFDVLDFKAGGACVLRAVGSGTPEGWVTAAVGSTYARTDGGAGTSIYVKETGTGSTGWVAK